MALASAARSGVVPRLCDRKLDPDGTPIACSGVVTAVFGDDFYIRSPDRACGIRVHLQAHRVFVSQGVSIAGTLTTATDGERVIEAESAVVTGSGVTGEVSLRVCSVGGADWHFDSGDGGGQGGVVRGAGLNTVGLPVTVAGMVTWVGEHQNELTVWDGSRWRESPPVDPLGNPGVRVTVPGVISPPLKGGDYVRVRGISGCLTAGGVRYAVIRARNLADVSVQGSGSYQPLCNESNGHYYEIVPADLGWDAARVMAETRQWNGMPGHLAVLNSAEEIAWVRDQLEALNSVNRTHFWLGGYQDRSAPDYREPSGGWRWVTGESWAYTGWAPGEPNNILYSSLPGRPTEDFVEWNLVQGGWNDLIGSAGVPIYRKAQGYLVEYEPAVSL